MALYTPAIIWEKASSICRIPQTEDKDGFTNYIIEIKISKYKWKVSRRYKQFVDLHEKLVKEYAIDKHLLPPKKIFGNRSESFIFERQKGLEFYLQSLIQLFKLLPESLALFLDFQNYEVRNITAALSENLFLKGEEILASGVPYELTPVHLHAITERLKLGEPTCSQNPRQDIAHVVDFITQLKHLVILGNFQYYEASNIIPNELTFDLSMFKNATTVEIFNLNIGTTLSTVDTLRTRLKSLIIHKTLDDISEILLCGIIHWCPVTDPAHTWPYWNNITFLNLSHNRITKIHCSIKLLPSVKHIDLSHNEIRVIENMETLSELSTLILTHNKIQDVGSLHTCLGNIHCLKLSSNKIKSLQGFSKLFSISELHLENNSILSIKEIVHLSKLPCLEILNLQHNPVTLTVDYRPQVLLLFGSLASELMLDGLKATEKEIDTVSILQALKQARDENSLVRDVSEVQRSQLSNNYMNGEQKHQQQNSPGANSAKKIVRDFYESSKFRQQVETLRKIGGSDWLHLLNEMRSPKVKTNSTLDMQTDVQYIMCCSPSQNESINVENLAANGLTPQFLQMSTTSFEISYPDWLLNLDASTLQLEKQVSLQCFQESWKNNLERSFIDCSALIKNAKLLWIVVLDQCENLMYEIPVCILMFFYGMVFLQLKKFSKASFENKPSIELSPEFLCIRTIPASDIISLNIGPCDAYAELKIRNNISEESIFVLMMDVEAASTFVSEFYRLYNIMPLYKINPFAKKMLELEAIDAGSSDVSKISVQKQILFGQRVCVSKMLHKCHHGILHYVFITPSHVILVEEKLNVSYIKETNTVTHPQFRICSLINVHTNIEQIQLKDIDGVSNFSRDLSLNHEQQKFDTQEETKLDILYKCGSWLIIEFESKLLLLLKFFCLKQRNEFLDILLCVRNQR